MTPLQIASNLLINEIRPRTSDLSVISPKLVAAMSRALHAKRCTMHQVREMIEDRTTGRFPQLPMSVQDFIDIKYLEA